MDMAEGEMWNGVEYPQESSAPAPGSGEMQSVYQNPGVKLIRRAELNIQTTEFDRVSAALDGLVSGCGGYFESKSVYGGSYRDVNVSRSGEYIVRGPAEDPADQAGAAFGSAVPGREHGGHHLSGKRPERGGVPD